MYPVRARERFDVAAECADHLQADARTALDEL